MDTSCEGTMMAEFSLVKSWASVGACLALGLTPLGVHAQTGADNREIIRAFAQTAYEKKQVRTAYETYVAKDLVQNNPSIADGREAAIHSLEGLLADPAARFEVKHIVVDGDIAVLHFHGTTGIESRSAAVMEMFRLKGGKIVEHWDVFQPVTPGNRAENSHPYF
jgi:predicted SnoaL-like aldol condensation-catalyzing enzyme